MSDEQGYNGWKNYETWGMALVIDNDQGSYEYSRELAETARQEACDDHENYRTAAGLLADGLNEWQEDQMPELDGIWSMLLHAGWSEIDWYEIAENYLSEVTK